MKKTILKALVLSTMFSAMSVTAFGATDNRVTKDVGVRGGDILYRTYAPELIIESSEDHTDDFSFILNLEGAQWYMSDFNKLNEPGLTYEAISDNKMNISIDYDVFQPQINDIEIPLTVEVEDTAGLIEVSIDSRSSGVSSGTYTFAHIDYPIMAISLLGVDTKEGTFGIRFEDDYPYSMPNTRLFEISMDNGFIFLGAEDVEGVGKYKDIVEFKIDPYDNTKAYIVTTESTQFSSGTIEVEGIQMAMTDEEVGTVTTLYVKPLYGNGGATSFPIQSFTSTEAEKSGIPIIFEIGEDSYTVLDEEFPMDAEAFIDDKGRTMLPLRAIANAFNIADDEIIWNETLQSITFRNYEGDNIVVVIGSNELQVGGTKTVMDTTAVIIEGRTYLPMRAILNGLGVDDSDIIWDAEDEIVTVYNKNK